MRNQWLVGDQALVSAMNFLTSAVLARMLGVHEFGVFSVFYIILQYLNSIQLALIVSPMMTLAPQITDESERAIFLKGMGGYQYAFSAAGFALTLLLALVLGTIVGSAYFFSSTQQSELLTLSTRYLLLDKALEHRTFK